MSITYDIQVEDDLLLVTASGFDDGLEDVQEYGMAVIRSCIENGCTRVLSDEVNLEYRLGTLDTFESARFLAEMVPAPHRVAIVCNPAQMPDAAFWKTVASNRGMQVRLFGSREEARQWIDE
jgi:hypothetical protein